VTINITNLMTAIFGQESGGNYGAVNATSGALGKYQILPSNLAQWGANAGYPNITPQQFLADPAAQDAIAQTQLQTYANQYGNVGSVAQAWYSGPGNVGKNVSGGSGYPDSNTYASQVTARYNAAGGDAGGAIQDSDFIDPNYDYSSAGTSSASSGASMGDTYSLFGNPSTASDASSGYNALSPGSTGLGSGSGLFGGSAAAAGGSDSVTYDTSGFNPDTTDWNVFDDGTSSAASSASSASSAASAASSASSAAGGGAPVDITDLPGADKAISGAGQAVQTGADTVGQNVETSAGGIVGTATSIFNKGQSYISGVVIVALIVLGLIFIAFGLGMFKHDIAAVI
jgi:hypothetical protein